MRNFHRKIWTVLILCTTLSGQTAGHGIYGRYTGPHSLGPYSIQHDMSMRSLLAPFGAKYTGKDVYCFADKQYGLYLYVHPTDDGSGMVSDVLLSSFRNCKHLPVRLTTIDPDIWKTPEHIGIGSTKEEVIRAYHQPVFIDRKVKNGSRGVIADLHDEDLSHIDVGDTSYLYSCRISEKQGCDNDLRVTRFGFRKGKLVWIHISNSE